MQKSIFVFPYGVGKEDYMNDYIGEYLTKTNDSELSFDTVEEAIHYFTHDASEHEDEFNSDLAECKTLSEVAELYNSTTDRLSDGSELVVKVINADLLHNLLPAIANLMDDDIRERVNREMAPCSDFEFLKRYLELDPAFEDILDSEFSISI